MSASKHYAKAQDIMPDKNRYWVYKDRDNGITEITPIRDPEAFIDIFEAPHGLSEIYEFLNKISYGRPVPVGSHIYGFDCFTYFDPVTRETHVVEVDPFGMPERMDMSLGFSACRDLGKYKMPGKAEDVRSE